MVVTFVPLGHAVMKKIPKNTNVESFKLFAAEHYIISSGFIGRFFSKLLQKFQRKSFRKNFKNI